MGNWTGGRWEIVTGKQMPELLSKLFASFNVFWENVFPLRPLREAKFYHSDEHKHTNNCLLGFDSIFLNSIAFVRESTQDRKRQNDRAR